jgi:hypothetical protein
MKKLIAITLLSVAAAFAQDPAPPPANPYAPYVTPAAVTICQMNMEVTPPVPSVDEATGLPRCFIVPEAVAVSTVKHMLTQTNGLDADGNVAYKYANWWDFMTKFFIDKLVLPMLDEFPPPNVAEAKANAAAAVASVDAAKALVIQAAQPQQ